MGISAFLFLLDLLIMLYLICTAAHPAACPSPSCPALASERERERCSYISMRRRTAPSTETSSWVSLSSSYYPSFLPFYQAPFSSLLSLFPSLPLSLSPSIPSAPVILVRRALISALFIIVGAPDQTSDGSSLWFFFPVLARWICCVYIAGSLLPTQDFSVIFVFCCYINVLWQKPCKS